MIIKASSPCRIGLFGGGTDVGSYAETFGGLCLSISINLRQRFEIDTDQVGFDIPKGATPEFYRAFFDEYGSPPSFRATFGGEITGGIGSSASAAVAILGALWRLKDKSIDQYELAEEAWNIEVNKLKMFGGKQDQYAAAFGGVNLFEFGAKTTVNHLSPAFINKLLPYILLFHTGENRRLPKIQDGLKVSSPEQIKQLDQIKRITMEAIPAIGSGDITTVANLLRQSWDCKKKSNRGVSNKRIDDLFSKAESLGSIGGKLLGSGGGGYCIFLVEPNKQKEFKDKIGIKWVDFSVDYQGISTRII